MPHSLLDLDDKQRLAAETALWQRGFVPVTGLDASSPQLHKVLPGCSVRQVVPDRQPHGRILWSHPGPSGLDPRALAPLSLVRVADGLGPDPLDEPLTLAAALLWLLTDDVERWLTRPEHRILLGGCLRQAGACLTHPVKDALAQEVAEALGDTSRADCRPQPRTKSTWVVARTQPADRTGLACSALHATTRLGQWHTSGIRGRAAWEMTLSDLEPDALPSWHEAGFSTDQAAIWCGRGSLQDSLRMREEKVSPHVPLTLPPGPTRPAKDRGIHWYAQFQLARRGRSHELAVCRFCGSKDQQDVCRTCRAEGRGAAVDKEWASYTGFAQDHPAYRISSVAGPVDCGDRNCQTALTASAADRGARL